MIGDPDMRRSHRKWCLKPCFVDVQCNTPELTGQNIWLQKLALVKSLAAGRGRTPPDVRPFARECAWCAGGGLGADRRRKTRLAYTRGGRRRCVAVARGRRQAARRRPPCGTPIGHRHRHRFLLLFVRRAKGVCSTPHFCVPRP